MDFGERIKLLRKKNAFTQMEFAKMINVSISTVSRYERNEIEPSVTIALKMSRELGCTLDYLVFGFSDEKIKGNDDLYRLTEQISTLSDENFIVVKKVVEAFCSEQTLYIISSPKNNK